ncbi:GGDEF domain-containing phosphodiesterase [Clostridium brassicae]|uniref:EAL domain-containing protein n=1 Tax=Clostridium brassicae TaxID=2999072 RepID=A0ABT4D498_9CLOT|nr:GGDEF domain-containing phosphodiesterase [Clostridium brassicae]MCY6957118.1 EAL domain-containing protein [Clostridium brassicae]
MNNFNDMEKNSLFIKNIPGLVFIKDKNMKTVFLSKKYEKILNKPLHEILCKKNDEIWLKDTVNHITQSDLEAFELNKGQYILTEETIEVNGENNTYMIVKFPIPDEKNEISLIGGVSINVTTLKEKEKRLEEEYIELSAVYEELTATEEELRIQYNELQEKEELLRKSEERYQLALLAAKDGIYDFDIKNNKMFYSNSWKNMLGYQDEDIEDSYDVWESLIHPLDKQRVVEEMNKYLNKEINSYNIEYRFKNKDGSYIWVQDRATAVWDGEGNPSRVTGAHINIDERIKKEKIIFNMAYYDGLTGLPNRRFFKEKLKEILKEDNKGIVLFLDLDNFKNINDTLGHDVGDELLKVIACKLKEVLGKDDILARFGGDEFLILQPNIYKREEAIKSVNKILDIFKDLWQVREHKIYITSSIGITHYPHDSSDLNIILRNVDTAAYDAKSSGKNRYEFFEKSMYDEMLRKTKIEKALREAIDNNELELYYQPQVEVKTGKIVSLEALIRWKHPEMGLVSPMEFIPIAEETGFIVDIGEWVLRTACKQNKEWKDKGYKYDTVAVNVSSIQLRQRGFVDLVKNILEETKLEPQFLELEITESVLMESLQKSIKILDELRTIGVKTALDDFGTGYSSLNYLMKIPIDTVKIDKTFIDNICVNYTQKSVIEGIILIAHEMKLDVVAEGVEVEDQLKILANKKCDKIQGYFFSKPYEANNVEKNLKKGFFSVSV